MSRLNSPIAAVRSSVEAKAGRAPLVRFVRPGASARRGGAGSGGEIADEDWAPEPDGGRGLLEALADGAGDELASSGRLPFFFLEVHSQSRWSWQLARFHPQLTSSERGPDMLRDAGK